MVAAAMKAAAVAATSICGPSAVHSAMPSLRTAADRVHKWLRPLRRRPSTEVALRQQATAAGASHADIEAAGDVQNPRSALVELIRSHSKRSTGGPKSVPPPPPPRRERPHFGAAQPVTISGGGGGGAKHVVMSYNWQKQKQVVRVHDLLTKLGVTCWMDIAGVRSPRPALPQCPSRELFCFVLWLPVALPRSHRAARCPL